MIFVQETVGVDRLNGKVGYCKCNDKIKIALASVHNYEEPSISGKMDQVLSFLVIVI